MQFPCFQPGATEFIVRIVGGNFGAGDAWEAATAAAEAAVAACPMEEIREKSGNFF